jgi:hypothetical protein
MYGLLDQTLDSVRRDLDTVLDLEVTAVVCTKLHLKSYTDTRTGVAGVQPAAWQFPDYRDKLVQQGPRWPPLGEQYQMRELLTEPWRTPLESLVSRGLARLDDQAVTLTPTGEVLVAGRGARRV